MSCDTLFRLICQDSKNGICRIDLGTEIEMGIDIGRGGDITVPEPHLNILKLYVVSVKKRRARMPQIMEPNAPEAVVFKKLRKPIESVT